MAESITTELLRNIPLPAVLAKGRDLTASIHSEEKDSEPQQISNKLSAGRPRTILQLQLTNCEAPVKEHYLFHCLKERSEKMLPFRKPIQSLEEESCH